MLTPVVRDNFTAVLLLCDPNGGAPENFYSVKGLQDSTLSVGENGLEWNVNSIVSTYFSPMTSSHTIRASCDVYQYTFNSWSSY